MTTISELNYVVFNLDDITVSTRITSLINLLIPIEVEQMADVKILPKQSGRRVLVMMLCLAHHLLMEAKKIRPRIILHFPIRLNQPLIACRVSILLTVKIGVISNLLVTLASVLPFSSHSVRHSHPLLLTHRLLHPSKCF